MPDLNKEHTELEVRVKGRMSRRTFLKNSRWLVAGLLLFPFPAYGYAKYAEPRWLQTNHIALTLQRLPKAMSGLRILQFSDVHLGPYYSIDHLTGLVERMNRMQPDLVCFTGDLYDRDIFAEKAFVEVVSRLKAPDGKYAVLGNHDYIDSAKRTSQLWNEAGFLCLHNEAVSVERNGARLWIAGVDDLVKGKPNLTQALRSADPSEFTLLLSHCPDLADEAVLYPVDLQLSGHSHGGQVRVPMIGPLVTPLGAKKYVDGLYKLENGKLFVYTNRGIGMSMHPIRFCCRPELTLFTLN
ncbi:metallophosphoesterase [Paenibacillus sp. J2TS4]|uniref:metallophosphoesterase n=1 Tax=Paenibacillus sp. J2TS4 TaxID=2807194 RepID=UPI001B2C2A5F|nr:metallophosphoesterase [Paenibacillus sp. J2TS4]GIP34565.1 metallophosphoesterase [Paenibacillus sp. J2TS4]